MAAALLAGGLLALGGCALAAEQPRDEAQHEALPRELVLAPDAPAADTIEPHSTASAGSTPGDSRHDQPAPPPARVLRGEDRQDWEPVAFHVPLGQIAHPPVYITTPPVRDKLGRVRGGTVESRMAAALERSGSRDAVADVVRLPVAPAWFYSQTALLPVKLLVNPPMNRELTPLGDAYRTPWRPVSNPDADPSLRQTPQP